MDISLPSLEEENNLETLVTEFEINSALKSFWQGNHQAMMLAQLKNSIILCAF